MNTISIYRVEPNTRPYTHVVKKTLMRSLRALRRNNVAVDVYLIGNRAMRFLNKKYRGKDKATNVLSFTEPKQFPHPELKRRFTQTERRLSQTKKGIRERDVTCLGEVYLAIPYIKEEAHIRNTPCSLLLTLYSIHGLLHLLGYKHGTKSDRIQMEKREKEMLNALR